MSRRQVAEVMDALAEVMAKDLKKNGVFNLVGLAKMTVVKKPAVKRRQAGPQPVHRRDGQAEAQARQQERQDPSP